MALRVVPRDDNAPHQIRLIYASKVYHHYPNGSVLVTCTCLTADQAIARVDGVSMEEVWALYNNPDAHDQTKEVFCGSAGRETDTSHPSAFNPDAGKVLDKLAVRRGREDAAGRT